MRFTKLLIMLAAVCLSPLAGAIDTQVAFEDPVLQARYEKLSHELRCPMCQNNTIADSPVGISADLRRELHEQIAAGKTDDEILGFMTARYGDFILYNPPLKAKTWLLWAAPGLLLIVGLASAGVVIMRRSRAVIPDDSADSEAGTA